MPIFCVLRGHLGAQKWFSGVPKLILWGSKPRLLNACPTNCEFSAPISDHVALKKAGPIELALELEVELELGFDVDLEIDVELELDLELALEPNVKNKCSNFVGVFWGGSAPVAAGPEVRCVCYVLYVVYLVRAVYFGTRAQ